MSNSGKMDKNHERKLNIVFDFLYQTENVHRFYLECSIKYQKKKMFLTDSSNTYASTCVQFAVAQTNRTRSSQSAHIKFGK